MFSEKVILDVVSNFDAEDVAIYNGTLFCNCTEAVSEDIRAALVKELETKVLISSHGSEYSFDFVG